MSSPFRDPSNTLPDDWPRRVRSAIVKAVSMSYLAFTATRAHAENHFNARIRVQAELDQRDREISLLREELRIKDARMDRLPAQRRALPGDRTAGDPGTARGTRLVAGRDCATALGHAAHCRLVDAAS